MSASISIERVTGDVLDRHMDELARLRIHVFREFPYLYDGDAAYEAAYLRTYREAEGSVIVIARDGERVVGASTAVPLAAETDEIRAPFDAAGYDPSQIFYLGESVLLRAYRGRGIGVRFFEEREAHGLAVAHPDWFAFCAVEREDDDPRRPQDYTPLDRFWSHRGYTRHPELRTTFSWREIGEPHSSPKPMVFWLKPVPSTDG